MRNKCVFSSRIFGTFGSRPAALVVLATLFAAWCAQAAQTTLVPLSSSWRYRLGTSEASAPTTAWRALSFNDATWSTGLAPLGYSEVGGTMTGFESSIATALPQSDSVPNWLSVYFRKTFNITGLSNYSSITLDVYVDDGAVAWINGVEAGRINLPAGELTFNCCTPAIPAEEQRQLTVTLTDLSHLVEGENILTIHAFNGNTTSSDFVVEASMVAFEDTEPPTVISLIPPAGSTNRTLTSIEVDFSEPVANVDAADLLINGIPATGLEFGAPGQFVFQFVQPATGTVTVAWRSTHGITDLSPTPRPFVPTGSWTYVLDTSLPITDLVLNEFMASNDRTLNDEDGDASDWIEIYNPGDVIMDIGRWALTDDANNLMKWRFPSGASVPANGYLVVFASNKNKTNTTGRLHTNFQLANGGEYLALVNPSTNVISEYAPTFPAQQTDVSYGRDAGDISQVGYFTTPTPGARNQSTGAGFSPEVVFSRVSGTFVTASPFSLTLSTPPGTSGAVIRYAFGTNVPGPTATVYSSPLQITNTIMIRARAFTPGLLPGPIVTRTYVGLNNANAALNYVTNVVTFNSHLPIMVLHNYGRGTFPADKTQEREVIVQVFEPGIGRSSLTNEPTLTEFGIAHLRGSSTIGYAKSSFFLEIQDEFRDGKNVELLGLPAESDWILYAPNNFDPPLFHNPLAHRLARDQGEYASRTRFVEVFLKDDATVGPLTPADYNGIYVLEEKIKRDDNRVNVARLEAEHRNVPEVTGGYIMSIDRMIPGEPQVSMGGGVINMIEPSYTEVTNTVRQPATNQLNYIRNHMNTFNSVLNNNSLWTNPVTGYAAYIDVDSWLTRHVHETLTHNIDALRLSGYFYKDRNDKIKYGPAWDYDRTQGSTDGRDFNPRTWRSNLGDLGTDYFNFTPWWGRLFNAPDFWQGWIDKFWELHDGPLSMENISMRIEELAAQIRPAHAREQARWSIPPRSGVQTQDGFSHNFGTSGYENEVRWKHVWYSNRLDFIRSNLLARPTLSSTGGLVSAGSTITLTPGSKPGSSVIYTLNGTDPRATGGAVAAGALSNNGPVTITVTTNVRVFARSWHPTHANLTGGGRPPISSRWSAPAQATVYTALPPLRITEIMYHPPAPTSGPYGDEEFEYIEFRNISGAPLNVEGYKVKGGVDFIFPAGTTLAGGERVLLVHNRAAFQQRYGSGPRIIGEYTNVVSLVDNIRGTNSLDNAGERLALEGRLREPILDFEYDDEWYPTTDGFGFSLVIVNDQADPGTWGLQSSWRPSGEIAGSPGITGTERTFPPVVVNEILTHSDPPPPTDTIELHNLSGVPADIGGWFLTDDFRDPKKYRIADATMIPANGFILFNEGHFNTGPKAFSLSSLGEQVYLFSGDANTNLTGYVHGFDFGAVENARTFGRYIISTGTSQYPRQLTPTLGAANSGPIVGPVVVSEINYHPPDFTPPDASYGPDNLDNSEDEYIELHNITGGTVPLFDPAHPTNTWRLRDAVDFNFPTNVSIPAGGFILVVSFNPANTQKLNTFRSRNLVPVSTPIYGPFEGKLDNSGEAVELQRPDNPEPAGPPNFGLVPYVLLERIRYADLPPWPAAADGVGPTLQRVNVSAYGNDPANWIAAGRTGGGPFGGGAAPTITQQPMDQTVVAGTTASLSVGATGSNLSYQWRFNQGILNGETNASLVFPNVRLNQQGSYDVAVMNPSGAVLSTNAYLTVLIPVAISLQPTNLVFRNGSTNVANFGQTTNNAVFVLSASSARPISYEWRSNGVPMQNVAGLHGATSNILTISNVSLLHNGTYQCFVQDAVSSAQSDVVRLAVAVPPFVIHPQLYGRHVQPVTALVGEDATFSVIHGGTPPFAYRWQSNSVGVLTNYTTTVFDTYRGVPTYFASFTLMNVQTAAVTRNYRLVITNLANPSPGILTPTGVGVPTAFLTVLADTDGDKAPDTWETQNGFNPNNSLDGGLDTDGDGMTNAAEFRAGTNPNDANSYLKVDQFSLAGAASLSFVAVSNKNYTVEFRDSLDPGPWSWLTDVSSVNSNRTVTVLDTNAAPSRYYRLVTPVQ